MSTNTSARKTDRRTIYTKAAIKESLLFLMESKPFEKITITDVCRKAEINRGTYYLHYYALTEVLDELLDEALSDADSLIEHLQTSDICSTCSNSLCRIIRHNKRYKDIFLNESLNARIIEKAAHLHKASFVEKVTARCNINKAQAEAIFYFQINGCLAISKWGYNLDCNSWLNIRQTIGRFISGGLEKVIDEK